MTDHRGHRWLATIIGAASNPSCEACSGNACPDHAAAAVFGVVEQHVTDAIRRARADAFAGAAAEMTEWAQFAEWSDPPKSMTWELWQVKARANRHAAELFADWAAEAMGGRWVWTADGSVRMQTEPEREGGSA